MDDSWGPVIALIVGICAFIGFVLLPLAMLVEWYFGVHLFNDPYYWFYTPR